MIRFRTPATISVLTLSVNCHLPLTDAVEFHTLVDLDKVQDDLTQLTHEMEDRVHTIVMDALRQARERYGTPVRPVL